MSKALQIVWEMFGVASEPEPAPTTVIPFPLAKRNPRKCRKARREELRLLDRSPGAHDEARALLNECKRCRACWTG